MYNWSERKTEDICMATNRSRGMEKEKTSFSLCRWKEVTVLKKKGGTGVPIPLRKKGFILSIPARKL